MVPRPLTRVKLRNLFEAESTKKKPVKSSSLDSSNLITMSTYGEKTSGWLYWRHEKSPNVEIPKFKNRAKSDPDRSPQA